MILIGRSYTKNRVCTIIIKKKHVTPFSFDIYCDCYAISDCWNCMLKIPILSKWTPIYSGHNCFILQLIKVYRFHYSHSSILYTTLSPSSRFIYPFNPFPLAPFILKDSNFLMAFLKLSQPYIPVKQQETRYLNCLPTKQFPNIKI